MVLLLIDECDFVTAKSEEEAIAFYKEEIGLTSEEFDMLSVEQIPSEKWEEIKVTDYDYETSEGCEYKKYSLKELIDELLEESEEPGIIASKEF